VLGRGARSVIASSWSVPDREAAALMSSFYQRLLTHSQSPSRALAQSMRELLHRDRNIDPAYWSAFSVMTIRLDTEE
jgi:CHAT domain-containing protein